LLGIYTDVTRVLYLSYSCF